jgi:hypothetical protein
MNKVKIVGLALLSATTLGSSAQAAVYIADGNVALGGSNVLFDTSAQGSVLYGDLNGGASNVIQFSSSTDPLVASGSGQATLTSTDLTGSGNSRQGGINQLTIMTVSPYLGLDGIQLNVSGESGTLLTFTAVDQSGTAYNFSRTLGNGENRYTFTTDLAYIASLSFLSNAGVGLFLDSVRQVRVGDLVQGTNPGGGTAVPGPIAGAGVPALMAFGGLMWSRRRRTAAA